MALNKYQKAWLKNLLSGKYIQGEGYLKQEGLTGNSRYCCLGVGYETCGGKWRETNFTSNGDLFGLTPKYRDLLGISGDDETKLSDMNDSGDSFKTIAIWLKELWRDNNVPQ